LDLNSATIKITASQPDRKEKVRLSGISNGVEYFKEQLNFKGKETIEIELNKENLPAGSFNIKLFDSKGNELAERPIWIDREHLNIDVQLIPSNSDETQLKLRVTDKNGLPLQNPLAISINKSDNQKSRLINPNSLDENAEYIASNNRSLDNRQTRFIQDLLVMTTQENGHESVYNMNPDTHKIKLPVQKGLELSGYAYDFNNQILRKTEIQAMAKSDEGIWLGEFNTDDEGFFSLNDIHIEGDAKVVFRTKGDEEKSRLVKVKVSESDQQYLSERTVEESGSEKSVEAEETKLPGNYPRLNADTDTLVELEEVKVLGKQETRKKHTPSMYGIEVSPNKTKFQDFERPRSIPQMLAEMPGLYVKWDGINASASLTRIGLGPLIYIIDGFILPQYSSNLSEIISMIPASDVERIELVIGPETSMFGSRGAGGALLFYTRTGAEYDYVRRKDGELSFQGYAPEIKFDTYFENLSKREKERSKLLYWNTDMKTDENGEAIITLPKILDSERIEFKASTISSDGNIESVIEYLNLY
ncbi:MAG: Plug domain-containing protein, partial [Flavobacteriaceae bacterium]|nr:Plug domain-containing protein [Flavobacteriaceae bacterium]